MQYRNGDSDCQLLYEKTSRRGLANRKRERGFCSWMIGWLVSSLVVLKKGKSVFVC